MNRFAVRAGALAIFALLPCLAQAQPTGPKDRGFALEIGMGTRLATLDLGMAGTYSLSGVDGGFFAGYKFGRFIVGGTMDFARVSYSNGTDTADTLLVFMPGMRVAILRSADLRAELTGEIDFGYGHVFVEGADDHNRFVYQIGPGLRLWFHPHFAIGALAALRGEFDIEEGRGGGTLGLTSVIGRVTFTGVF